MGDKLTPVICNSCSFVYYTKDPEKKCEHCGESNLRVLTELQAHELMHKIFRKFKKKNQTMWEV